MKRYECQECENGHGYACDHCDNCGAYIEPPAWGCEQGDELPPEWQGMHIISSVDLKRQSKRN